MNSVAAIITPAKDIPSTDFFNTHETIALRTPIPAIVSVIEMLRQMTR